MNTIVRLTLASMTILALNADANAAGTKKDQALTTFNLEKAQAPTRAQRQTIPTSTYEATLMAVFPDSVVIRRSIDPVELKRGISSGRIALGARSLAAIETMVASEGKVLERVYLDAQRASTSQFKTMLFRQIQIQVADPVGARRTLHSIKSM